MCTFASLSFECASFSEFVRLEYRGGGGSASGATCGCQPTLNCPSNGTDNVEFGSGGLSWRLGNNTTLNAFVSWAVTSLSSAAHSVAVGCCKARALCSVVDKTSRVDLKRVFLGNGLMIFYYITCNMYLWIGTYIFCSEVQAILGANNSEDGQ